MDRRFIGAIALTTEIALADYAWSWLGNAVPVLRQEPGVRRLSSCSANMPGMWHAARAGAVRRRASVYHSPRRLACRCHWRRAHGTCKHNVIDHAFSNFPAINSCIDAAVAVTDQRCNAWHPS